jgi:hypothetical protein
MLPPSRPVREWITASGEWVKDRTHRRLFKAHFLPTSAPTSAEGIEKYLLSGIIRGGRPVSPLPQLDKLSAKL